MRNHVSILFGLLAIFTMPAGARAGLVYPPHNPPNTSGGEYRDWQLEWGSIHMNSGADGLNDPGTPASPNGRVPCLLGALCNETYIKTYVTDLQTVQPIDNGIKYDIKNSLLNCMSKPIPNWAKKEGNHTPTKGAGAFPYMQIVCEHPSLNMKAGYGTDEVQTPAMIYMPIYDRRSNDNITRDPPFYANPGCQQQITNTCVHDVHECTDPNNTWQGKLKDVSDPSKGTLPGGGEEGWRFPVTHNFTADEVADLGGAGAQLPSTYYKYTRITDTVEVKDSATPPPAGDNSIVGVKEEDVPCKAPKTGSCGTTYSWTKITKTRHALSRTESPADADPRSPVVKVDNSSDPNLARLRAYWVHDTDPYEDKSTFVVVDPSDFYDLRLYVAGGKYDAGYKEIDAKTGWVQTYDSCPVLGLKNGYSGICDPSGRAGCNLPIYKVGTKTRFTVDSGKKYEYTDYQIAWSAYAKKWAFISADEYLENLGEKRKPYYLTGYHINKNPVLMIERADEYCEPLERMSDPKSKVVDMPCIQYLQYQAIDAKGMQYAFQDLFNPGDEDHPPVAAEYDLMQLYSLDAKGRPDVTKPVPGTGTDVFIGGDGSKKGFVSFLDSNNAAAIYNDASKNLAGLKAVTKFNAVKSTSGSDAPGLYLGKNKAGQDDPAHGAGVGLDPGTAGAIRVNYTVDFADGSSGTCVVAVNSPVATNRVFVPTNSPAEFKAFVAAASRATANKGSLGGVTVRKCSARFLPNTDAPSVKTGQDKVATGTDTWVGMTKCADLTEKPACNQAKMISARRYCQLETGALDDCGACLDVADTAKDAALFTPERVDGEILQNPFGSRNRCYFTAACFNKAADGCPPAGTAGGHVFCLGPETKITMADGSEKAISEIKAGEEVMAFAAKQSRSGALKKARVKATAITKNQKVIKIDGMRITPLHKIVLATGRAVMAQDIKVGDKILRGEGSIVTVSTVVKEKKPISVYNLVLEDGSDGYIANGLRVLSYPVLKGMEIQK